MYASYPHKTDDIPCTLVRLCTGGPPGTIYELLTPLAVSLPTVWPQSAMATPKAKRISLGARVPSLVVVEGSLINCTSANQSGHASLLLSDGSAKSGIKIACSQTLREATSLKGVFILGLARAHDGVSCEMLLVGFGPTPATADAPVVAHCPRAEQPAPSGGGDEVAVGDKRKREDLDRARCV